MRYHLGEAYGLGRTCVRHISSREEAQTTPLLMHFREATPEDRSFLLQVHRLAFAQSDEADLVESLLADPTAQPLLSLVAEEAGNVIGHALFTRLSLLGPDKPPLASILAPLAVVPAAQRSGVGRGLIESGSELLASRGLQLLFVLGDPRYYMKHGFTPASPHGLRGPYVIEPDAAWMVKPLGNHILGSTQGQVRCADALAPEKYWRE